MPEIVALIMSLIIERPMCVECIADRAHISTEIIKASIDRMRATVRIQDGTGRCRTCGRTDQPVFWLTSSPYDPPPD